MPAKGSRGRGRGRGRGSAPAAVGREPETQNEQPPSNEASLSTPSTGKPIEELTSARAVLQQQDMSQNPSPNSSPVSAPTETPASTPARPLAQKPDSPRATGRGAFGVGRGVGERTMSTKFKPKAVRRTVEAREKAEREEEARRRGREEEALRQHGAAVGSSGRGAGRGSARGGTMRGRGGRGRGDAMGRGGLDRNKKALGEASGLFGIAPAGAGRKPASVPSGLGSGSGGGGGVRTGAGNGGVSVGSGTGIGTRSTANAVSSSDTISTRIKQETDARTRDPLQSRAHTSTTKMKLKVTDPIYPEEQEEGSRPPPRVDIEHINLVTDNESDNSDIVESKGKKRKQVIASSNSGLRPIRLERREHKDRITLVNTEPAAAPLTDGREEFAEDDTSQSMFTPQDEDDIELAEQVLYSRTGKNWSGAWRDADESKVKYDPDGPTEAMDIDLVADIAAEDNNSKEPLERIVDGHEDPPRPTVTRDRSKFYRKVSANEKLPVLQTEEDRAEYQRHLTDVQVLVDELGGLQSVLAIQGVTGVIDLDREMSDGRPQVKDKEGRLYLFQFPPILPPLRNQIKSEEEINGGADVMEIDAGPSNAAGAVDLTLPDTEEAMFVKAEPGLSTAFHTAPDLVTEEGSIGKLVVRQSGKVELDWGGTLMKLGRGAESDFLTTTLIVDGREEGVVETSMGIGFRREGATPSGTVSGMGRIMGKFVVTPDWAEMTDLD